MAVPVEKGKGGNRGADLGWGGSWSWRWGRRGPYARAASSAELKVPSQTRVLFVGYLISAANRPTAASSHRGTAPPSPIDRYRRRRAAAAPPLSHRRSSYGRKPNIDERRETGFARGACRSFRILILWAALTSELCDRPPVRRRRRGSGRETDGREVDGWHSARHIPIYLMFILR